MKRFIQLSSIAFVILVAACNAVSQEDLDKITALEAQIQQIESKVNSMNLEKIENIAATVDSNMQFIRDNYRDNSNRDFIIHTLSDYRAIRKPMSKYPGKHHAFMDEIAYTKNQLKTLRSDLNAGNIDQTKFIEYMESEAAAIKVLKSKSDAACDQVTALMKRYDELNPAILEAMESVK